MNRATLAYIASAVTGAITLLGANGPALVEAGKGIPAMLAAWTTGTPVGGWALLAGLVLPVLLMFQLDRWVPVVPGKERRRAALLESGTGLLAVWIVFMLVPSRAGLLLGVLCGLLAPQIARGLLAAVRAVAAMKD